MARNRRNQSAAIRFGPALKALVLFVIVGGAGVGYVWQKRQISELGRQIGLREKAVEDLDHRNKKLQEQLAALRSPAQLNERVQRLNLGLTQPAPGQVWRLPEPVATPAVLRVPGASVAGAAGDGLALH